ncbi:Lrp/AsnC family transcriptional regulator [Burkholderia sp. Ac-20353]|uniref:Lrp/AsnC family transcriptional regulator n=1 Tax=Burkholderia sp. Ac-20353 TaxID=2703894 RepID=UPI00197C4A39|nr:Lrp/AsnC family transcriptional regulator [Burkholderia sp. Ac-20353]MBN3786510.1 Lrp/AsnC family transcriptional regulator [Burkholderia sp. Ac-20353]
MTTSNTLDRTDCALLEALQENARLTVAELGERVSLTSSPCWRRVKRLEELGLVRAYRAILSPEQLGYGVTAFVNVMMGDHGQHVVRQFEKRISEIPEIVSCHHVSGRYDFLLEVVAVDLKSFGEFARNVLQALPGVKELYSSFSLKAVKDDRMLPLPNPGAR